MKLYYFLIIILCFLSCRDTTTSTSISTTTALDVANRIEIIKTSNKTTHIGIITNHNYGATYSFSYDLELNNNQANWEGRSKVPLELVVVEDQIFIKSKAKKSFRIEKDTNSYNYIDSIVTLYEQHEDERYLFKWFGDEYWYNIDSTLYNTESKKGLVFKIPTDNDL